MKAKREGTSMNTAEVFGPMNMQLKAKQRMRTHATRIYYNTCLLNY